MKNILGERPCTAHQSEPPIPAETLIIRGQPCFVLRCTTCRRQQGWIRK